MNIQVRYFASVREQLGSGELLALAPDDDGAALPRTVGELRAWLSRRSPAHAAALGRPGLRTAYNQTLCGPEQPILDGGEVAFFPPVTGG